MSFTDFPFLIDRLIGEGVLSIFGYNYLMVWIFMCLMLTFFGIALRLSNITIIISIFMFTFFIMSSLLGAGFMAILILLIGITLGILLWYSIFGR